MMVSNQIFNFMEAIMLDITITKFVVFPSNRGGYNWQGVPESFGSYELRKPTPKKWWGKPASDLQKMTGVATATFCHNTGFLGATETLEDAIQMAKLSVEA